MKNLMLRYAVAVIAIPLILLLLMAAPSWVFNLFAAAVMLAALYEWLSLIQTQKIAAPRFLGMATGLVMLCGIWGFALSDDGLYLYITAILILTGISVFGLTNLNHDIKQKAMGNGSVVMAIMICCWGGGSLILIREMQYIPDGRFWIILLFAMVWSGDAGAMHFGKLLGRHKLTPIISPRKTIEGLIGGIIVATVAGFLVRHYLHLPIPIWHMILLAPISVLLAHLGDLTGSMAKRVAGVKDSGHMIPGHGGYLDRFDNLMFSAPFLYLYIRTFIG